jgi:Polyketide cyclase / dehydrase and lipid transport
MKIARYVGFGIVGVILLLLIVAFLLPRHWSVERSIVIAAPPAAIYPLVANMKSGWPQWSSFDFEDPEIRYSYSGPDEGVGAIRSWTSPHMGDGTQRIVKADPATGVEFRLEMAKTGMALTGQLAFEPTGGQTKVTWTDSGEVGFNPIHRFFAAFLDRMMGGTFEKSLATLKQKAEATAAKK